MKPPRDERRPAQDVTLALAGPGEMAEVRRLLEASGLPFDDVGRPGQEFRVARSGREVVGCAGAEIHGGAALLRSLAVSAPRRGQGIGEMLLRAIVGLARKRGAAISSP